MKLPPAQLGPQGLGTKKDLTAFGSSQSFQQGELFPEGPPQQWGALIGSPNNMRVSIGEERNLISWFHGFPRLVPFYTRIYQSIKSKIRVTLNEVRHEAFSVTSAHYHFANKKAKQKNIIAPKVEFTLGKNTHGKAKKQNVCLFWSLFCSYFPAHVGRERDSRMHLPSWESMHLSVLKWSRNTEFLEIFK